MTTRTIRFAGVLLALAAWTLPASAVNIDDTPGNGERALYEIFNDILDTQYASSAPLMQRLVNPHDYVWGATPWGAHVESFPAGRGRLFDFGYIEDNCWQSGPGPFHVLIENPQAFVSVPFDPGRPGARGCFDFALRLSDGQLLSSRSSENPDQRDLMLTFDVTDIWDKGYPREYYTWRDYHRVFVIAFEDLDESSQDYNDFVALVFGAKPIPEPATLLLLSLGGLGLVGLRRRNKEN